MLPDGDCMQLLSFHMWDLSNALSMSFRSVQGFDMGFSY